MAIEKIQEHANGSFLCWKLHKNLVRACHIQEDQLTVICGRGESLQHRVLLQAVIISEVPCMQYWPSWQALKSNEYRAGAMVPIDKRRADPQLAPFQRVLNIKRLIQGVGAQDVRGT